MKPTQVLFFLSLLFLTPLGLRAQTSAAAQGDDFLNLSLEELLNVNITTASKKSEKINQAPATVYVITQDDIKNRGYVFLKDALRDLPGMETIENYFAEQGTLVPVRGVLGNNKIIVLINGRRVNPPGGEEMMFKNDFNIVNAKQIEVIYGPGATLYGQDAINAVVNVITEHPDKPALTLMARGGMYNTKEGVVSFAGDVSKGKRYIGLTTSLSYANDGLSRIDKAHPEWWAKNYAGVVAKTGIDPEPHRFDKGFNPFVRLETKHSYIQIWHRESSRSSAEGGYAPILQFTKEAIWHDRSTVASASNQFVFSDQASITSSMSFNRYEISPESRYVFPVNDSTIYLNDYKYGVGTGTRIDEQLNYAITKKFSMTAGIMGAFYHIIPKATIPGGVDKKLEIGPQGGSFVYYTRKGDPTSKVEVPRVHDLTYNVFGGYTEFSYVFSDKVKAVAGIRADMDSRTDEIPLSPRASLIYNPDSNFSIKYIYTRGFVQPAPYFSYNIFDNGQNLNTFNSDLSAEHATSHELSAGFNTRRLSLTTAVYYNTQQNLIVLEDGRVSPANLVQDTVYLNPDGTGARELTRTANSGNTQAYGADIFGTYKTPHVAAWASVSYVHFTQELNNTITHLHNISPVNVRLGVTWQAVKKLSVTPSIIFRTTPVDMPNATGLEDEIKNPYCINFHANYEASCKFMLFVDGTNVTNHKYMLKGALGPAPQEPIRLLVGARYLFD